MKGEIIYTLNGETECLLENRNEVFHDWVKESCKRANEMKDTIYILTPEKLQGFLDDADLDGMEHYELAEIEFVIRYMKTNNYYNYYYEVVV